jgi:hypothetical protein
VQDAEIIIPGLVEIEKDQQFMVTDSDYGASFPAGAFDHLQNHYE